MKYVLVVLFVTMILSSLRVIFSGKYPRTVQNTMTDDMINMIASLICLYITLFRI